MRFLIVMVLAACSAKEETKPTAPPSQEAAIAGRVKPVTDAIASIETAVTKVAAAGDALGDQIKAAVVEADRAVVRAKLAAINADVASARSRVADTRTRDSDARREIKALPLASDLDKRNGDEAMKELSEAEEKLDKLGRDLDELATRISNLENDLTSSQNDADRAAAKAKLDELRREQADAMKKAHK